MNEWSGHRPGGGQVEGFAQAEALLVEHAEYPPEPESTTDGFDLSDAGPDDPGRGPGPQFER